MKSGFYLIFCSLIFVCCSKDEKAGLYDFLQVPFGFDKPKIPADDELTADRIKLGKLLFYDKLMSRDTSLSCASCHKPELAFTDGLPKSVGIDGKFVMRNASTLTNVIYNPYLLSEGGVPTLEQQILVPIMEHNEFDTNILILAERLNNRKDIIDLSLKAYGRPPDPYVITRAIAAFERTIISGNSLFDNYLRNSELFSPKQYLGSTLFFSERTNCSSCHSGVLFTNFHFENNGLYVNYDDEGRKRLTGKDKDEALFKVPTLRNIAVTAPYMHDGSFQNLRQVIEHYNKGGAGYHNQSKLVKPLYLTEYEKGCLIEFLNTLTDTEFLSNKKYRL